MISFIVPAYNAQKSIERAVDSILNQKNNNIDFEVIVINDGSTDNTSEVMKKYEDNPKIIYYEKENGGISDARNYGMRVASGNYFIFVDSDDYISENLLKDIEEYIKDGIDLIKWNPIFVNEDGKEIKRIESVYFKNISGDNGFNRLFGKDNLIDVVWNYAIKKDIMINFPVGTYHEDFAIMPLVVLNAKTMVSTNKYEYYYVQSENSIMRNNDEEKTKKKLEDKLYHFDRLITTSEKMNINQLAKENLALYVTNSLICVLPELSKSNQKYFKEELKKRNIAKYIKCRNIKQVIKKIIYCMKFRDIH